MKVTSLASRGVPPSATATGTRGRTPLTSAAPTSAPASCARMYRTAARPSILSAIHRPVVTAGFKCPPEMPIVAETTTARPTPCASATASAAIGAVVAPAPVNATALPAPRKTNIMVPTNSAVSGRRSFITDRPLERLAAAIYARLRPPQHQRRVDAAEPEGIRHHHLGRGRAPLAREAVEVARGVRALEIDRGREPAPLHRERADRRAERVPVVALRAADGEPVGVLAEHLLERAGFGRVVERRRGPVRVDVAHLGGRQPRVRQREPDRPGGLAPVGAGRRHVIRVVG